MGWTYTSTYSGGGIRAFLDREFTGETEAAKWEILDSAYVGQQAYYAATRYTDKTNGEVKTFALVCLVKHVPRARDGLTLGWKSMDEDMGPSVFTCPIRILEQLDPPTSEYAKGWRQGVLEHHNRRAHRPKPGQSFETEHAIEFTDGSKEQRFCVETHGRKRRYRGLTTGLLYRISKIESLRFKLIDERPN